ncbi:MAG: molybdopterin-dependent oxidoreductase [Xanthomonadales bacterium]
MSAYRIQPPAPPFARKAVAASTPTAPGFEPVRAVSRRDFLKAGSVLVVGVSLFGCSPGEPPAGTAAESAPSGPWTPDVYVTVEADGLVRIISHRCEMGQGVKTSLPSVVADEMEADWSRVLVEQATGDKKYGDQSTGGSLSIISFYQRMREAGASVRAMLEQAAAQQWGVPVADCRAANHRVVHGPSGRSADFAELVAAASVLAVPPVDRLRLKTPDEFRYIGKELQSVDLPDIVRGEAKYGADIVLPGMKYAAIARPPVVLGKVRSFNADKAMAVPGVEQVVELPAVEPPVMFKALGGVAVIADNSWAALKARDLLEIEWDEGPNADYESEAFRQQLLETVRQPGEAVRDEGDFDAAAAAAAQVLEAEYYAPHLNHMMMEPPAAVASVTEDSCEIWAPTQDPQSLIPMAAAVTGLPEDRIRVNMTLCGGAFGRKGKGDYADEAVHLSKAVGAPVKVQWSREDEVRHGYYHTVSAQHLAAALDEEGRVTGWRHRLAYPTIFSIFDPAANSPQTLELGLGALTLPYAVDSIRLEKGAAPAKVRIGWLRSVAIFQSFGINVFTDEIAHARGMDPLDNLLDLLGPDRTIDLASFGMENKENHPFQTGRLRGVIELAAEKAGWGRSVPAGHGLGIAAQYSFDTYAASVVEVAVADDGSWHVPRVVMTVDCGQVVNLDRAVAQQEGAAVMGLGFARYGRITARDGRIEQGNFNNARVVRHGEHPQAEVHFVQNHLPPSGIGEPGVPPFAPALINAIFAATGKRLRELPIGNRIG